LECFKIKAGRRARDDRAKGDKGAKEKGDKATRREENGNC